MREQQSKLLDRRQALGALGAIGLGAVAAACSSGSGKSSSAGTTSTFPATSAQAAASSSSAACTLTPEVTEGPFYLDINDVRQDITEGRAGTPLALRITVVDATACTTIQNAAVDIWHCDAGGVYSGVQQSTGQTFLRGTQLTDANGTAAFDTIYPGWYQGRAVHVHMKVHVNKSVVHTGQLFFDDGLSDTVFQNSPYSAQGTRDTRNSQDNIFTQAGGSSAIVPLTANGGGYAGTITVGVKST